MTTRKYSRRTILSSSASAGAAIIARPYIARADTKEVLIAEPVHGTGYLPLYIGIAKNLFDDVKVNIVTIETGSGHTNAVLSGQAFAFIGGPEHCAFAKVKGAELRCVVNCVDRGNVYFCAAPDRQPTNKDWPSYFKGKTIATSGFGGTPNSITRYLLKKWKLDPTPRRHAGRDCQFRDHCPWSKTNRRRSAARPSRSSLRACAAASGASRSSISRRSSGLTPIQLSMSGSTPFRKTPDLVAGFVRGMMKSLKFVQENHDEAAELAQKQFPTMALEDLKATLARSFADEMWSKDGMVSRAAWDTAKSVVMGAGILKTDVGYDEIIDMSFVEKVRASL